MLQSNNFEILFGDNVMQFSLGYFNDWFLSVVEKVYIQ